MRYDEKMNHGFFRVAAASPETVVADCEANASRVIDAARDAAGKGARLVVFPELCVTGYTCGDLFMQSALRSAAARAAERVAEECAETGAIVIVGLPVAAGDSLFNCAAVMFDGGIIAIIPKTFIPNYGEFYEARHFAPSTCARGAKSVFFSKKFPSVPFGTDILIADAFCPDFVLSAEICEDLWAAVPPSSRAALSGATVVANLSASNEVVGKDEYRRMLVKSQSARAACAYVYSCAGPGESTQDMVFAARGVIAENGSILAEAVPFECKTIFADIDLERLRAERRRANTFAQGECAGGREEFRTIQIDVASRSKKIDGENPLMRFVDPRPFVPSDKGERAERCRSIIEMQSRALAKRVSSSAAKGAVIGLSGGIDSTLALLVTARAFDLLDMPRSKILALTMPCFGTTKRTKANATALALETGVSFKKINISKAVRGHLRDIGRDESVHDTTYENCQARERTQVLMDMANSTGGIVVGTGDLSELALGWCTYNGDQMSMYGVNSSIPKTLARHLVASFADDAKSGKLRKILLDILATPVSPELLPPKNGAISQNTEEIVGPYSLHDFFLYNSLRFGFSPSKILFLAERAGFPFNRKTIIKWMKVFFKRFFSQQFKRSCMPDGAKVGTVSLSPRGDWRMPSDASASAWLSELDSLE